MEDARTALDEAHQEIQTALDRRTETLKSRLHQKPEEELHAGHQEIGAMGEAAHEVFQARIRSALDRSLEEAELRLEQAGGRRKANLERSVETQLRDYERRLQHLGAAVRASWPEADADAQGFRGRCGQLLPRADAADEPRRHRAGARGS